MVYMVPSIWENRNFAIQRLLKNKGLIIRICLILRFLIGFIPIDYPLVL
jgi:hypothetical protein